MNVLRAKNYKFSTGSATIQSWSAGYYVKWIDEHRIVRMKRFATKLLGRELAHSRAVAFAASKDPAIRNLVN